MKSLFFLFQTANLCSQAEQVYMSTSEAYNATLQLINETSSLGVSARTQANQLLQRSMQQALQAMQFRNVRFQSVAS